MVALVLKVASAGTIQEALKAAKVVSQPGDVLCYAVQKPEDVSAAKVVALLKNGSAKPIVGKGARMKVGLPMAGKGSVKPADVPTGFTLYVQSTSHNRSMPAGSSLLVLREGRAGAFGNSSSASGQALPTGKRKADEAAVAPSAKMAKVSAKAWTKVDSVSVRDYSSPAKASIAGFDMDSTLITTKSGQTFAKSKDDWVFWASEVVPRLQDLSKTHKLVLITNQGGIAKGKCKLEEIQAKIDAVQGAVGVPLLAMILSQDDIYRKPLPTAWKLMTSRFNGGVAVSAKNSFYCGDAAGRAPPLVKKKDFSDNDLKFALNLGVAFQTPEECFLGKIQKFEREKFDFDPRKLGEKPSKFPVPSLKKQTLILCVGPPGSGKSNMATQHFTGCERVNQDTLKTKEKCLKACKAALEAGKSVVVDNQNKSKADRAPYLALARAAGASSIAIFYDVPKGLCFHLNSYRMLNTKSSLHRPEKVPPMIIHGFYKNVQKPEEKEGFDKVYRVGLEHFTVNKVDADLQLLRSFLG